MIADQVVATSGGYGTRRLLVEQFNSYASIVVRAGDESVVGEAQRLASQMILRLAMFGRARGSKLLEGDG